MRRTVDLPDDLAQDLEKMSKHLSISQVGLLTIAGYSLISHFKKHGSSMFEIPLEEHDNVKLIDSGTTRENIAYVEKHISDFGRIKYIKVFNVDHVPDKYHIPRPTSDSTRYYEHDYRLILINEENKQWWFHGCSCGYRGEGVRGTHTILTLLGIPFSFEKLARNSLIDEPVDQDYRLWVTLSRSGGDPKNTLGTWLLNFPSPSALYKFSSQIDLMGFSWPRERDSYESDIWAGSRHIIFSTTSQLNDINFKTSFEDTLKHIVRFALHGTVEEVTEIFDDKN